MEKIKNMVVMCAVGVTGITALTLSYYFSFQWFSGSLGFNAPVSILFSTFSVTAATIFWILHISENIKKKIQKWRPTVYGAFSVFFVMFSIFCSVAGQIEQFNTKVDEKVENEIGVSSIVDTSGVDFDMAETRKQLSASNENSNLLSREIIKFQAKKDGTTWAEDAATLREKRLKEALLKSENDKIIRLENRITELEDKKEKKISDHKDDIEEKKTYYKEEDNRFAFLARIFHCDPETIKLVITLVPSVLIDLAHPECFSVIVFGYLFSDSGVESLEPKKKKKKKKKSLKKKVCDTVPQDEMQPLYAVKTYSKLRFDGYMDKNRQLNGRGYIVGSSKISNPLCIKLNQIAVEEGLVDVKGKIHFAKSGVDEAFFFKRVFEKYKKTLDM